MSESDKKIFKVNAFWIIGVLIAIVCGLITVLIGGVGSESILNFISGFSTLLSIVLSIIAIFYSFLSGIESQRINQKTESEIQHINDKIDILTSNIHKNLEAKTNLDNNLSSAISIVNECKDDLLKSESQTESEKLKMYAEKLNGLKIQLHKIGEDFNESK